MREQLAELTEDVTRWLPESEPDGSEVGANYTDAFLKCLSGTLSDGTRLQAKRRGIKITVKLGEESGEALMRRIEHGPEAQAILTAALDDAMGQVGGRVLVEDGVVWLER